MRLLRGGHLCLELAAEGSSTLTAMAWRWTGPEPSARFLDLAFRLRQDHWQGQPRLQLEVEALRPSAAQAVVLMRGKRRYQCEKQGSDLLIRNPAGEELRVPWLAHDHDVQNLHPHTLAIVQEAAQALGLVA